MNHPKAKRPSVVGVLFIAVFFSILIVWPRLFTKRHFSFPVAEENSQKTTFPLDQPFWEIHPESKRNTRTKVTLRDFFKDGNHTLVVNFWATWCPPCVEEFPSFEFLNREFKGRSDVPKIVAISVDDSDADVVHFYQTLGYTPTLTILRDPQGAFSRSIGTIKFPETYWIRSDGKILYKWIGPQNWLSREVLKRFAFPIS